MTQEHGERLLQIEPDTFRLSYDRRPFGFTHRLHGLSLFKEESLYALATKYRDAPQHYFVAAGAPTPGTQFYLGPAIRHRPHEALQRLDGSGYRVLLKRMELFDPDYADLLHQLFAQVVELLGGLDAARVVRLESAIFVSAASTITPFHYDPEVNFFAQIEGPKTYHVYAPPAVSEAELESFMRVGWSTSRSSISRAAIALSSTRSRSVRARGCTNRRTLLTGSRPRPHARSLMRSCSKRPRRAPKDGCALSITTCVPPDCGQRFPGSIPQRTRRNPPQ